MTDHLSLSGVYAAALTPLKTDTSLALDDLLPLLRFLAGRGCHGALLFGTTGEGPSFAPEERLEALRVSLAIRQEYPAFRLLLGTGTPSLEETATLTRSAFDLGVDGVVVLPPYFFRKVSDEGLFAWFSQVLSRAVPPGGALLGYHIPPVSGVALSLDLLARLKDHFPDRFAGLKDSSADPDHARRLGGRFGKDLLVLNGNDRLFSLALQNQASGCITALANLRSPDLRRVWDAYQEQLVGRPGSPDSVDDQPVSRTGSPAYDDAQARLDQARAVLERYPPAPPFLKAILAHCHGFPRWPVRPPLQSLAEGTEKEIIAQFDWTN